MKNLTPELIDKAKAAKSAEELLALAKENDVEITADEAKKYFEQLNANAAVSDEELELVAGGRCGSDEVTFETGEVVSFKMPCPNCEYLVGIYDRADGIGGCFVQCAKCRKTIWLEKTQYGIEKVDRRIL